MTITSTASLITSPKEPAAFFIELLRRHARSAANRSRFFAFFERLTQRHAFGVSSMALVSVLICATASLAHPPPPRGTRELVRIQGYRGQAPPGVTVARDSVLIANGVEHRFAATDWRVFRLQDTPDAPEPKEPPRHALQASFEVLARFAKARADQTVTILAERRPGSADLFVLTLDLCPHD